MRPWLRWLTIGVVGGVAAALFVYLFLCGPGLSGRPGPGETAHRGAPAERAGEPPPVAPGTNGGTARTLRIGWTAWSDAEVVSLLAQRLLERRMGLEVERVMTDIGIQYQGVANGDLDIMLMAWLPVTHRDYWEKVRDRVVNLGVLYTGRLGWVVPAYVPEAELAAIPDLADPAVGRRVGGRVQGIDPGSGLMQASERAMEAYNLEEMDLVPASGAAMTAVLDRAIRNRDWVVVTAWRPHWVFAAYDLRFLKDPEGVLGGEERVHALARQGFHNDFPPRVTGFFSRLYLPQEELAALLLEAQDTSPEEAVEGYIREHPARIRYWLTGEVEEPGKNPQSQ
ncbi:glycine/betaine ABC transporter substrate-binding protein [Thiohalorhabdus denitrificans]|uniref:Glycine betaine/proline transport system substrate-binding protein n=1 Tax=Thiohalorhabdus denitrificans TaxID=381306 RepID=A0A0P9CX02_9GAMM|nr:glycine betaine ABC transporter substrate-binding protein [Thiohalorhabdus denitrificans]KPV41364.1 glycine/betaine ABC transporter substrate-binding protein [Thiohalorhabdus denitrificans]SCY24605.1 glycine betaine/proline transport system substrate-binding protein [Thiohalorhabdus denitrificans]